MFGKSHNIRYRKQLKEANYLSVQPYVWISVCISCVYMPVEADVLKLRVYMKQLDTEN